MFRFFEAHNIPVNKSKILFFILPVFFLLISENIISLVFPIITEQQLHSNLLLGLVVSGISLISIFCDLIFPSILNNKNWKGQFVVAIILAFGLTICLDFSIKNTSLLALFIAGVLWGIYYELFSFANDNFFIEEDKTKNYTFDWGLIGVVYSVTAIIGPILGGLIIQNIFFPLIIIQITAFIGILVIVLKFPHSKVKVHTRKSKIQLTFNFLREIKLWSILIKKVFPLILMQITLRAIDSIYWTLGGLFALSLFHNDDFTWLPVVIYSLPFIIGSSIIIKLNICRYKKLLSQLFLLCAGMILTTFAFVENIQYAAFLVIISSSFYLSLTDPLNMASFSDLLSRLGEEKEHLIGIKKTSGSIAYLIAPITAGFIADKYGYAVTFTLLGLVIILIASFLIVITPKKIKLPLTEIKKI